MRGKPLALLVLGLLLVAVLYDLSAEPLRDKRKPLTLEQLTSPPFRALQLTTSIGALDLRVLYETSGAEDFKEFARAMMVAQLLRLERQIVLRALFDRDLKQIVREFGYTEEQAEDAIDKAKKQLEKAEEAIKKGQPYGLGIPADN